MLALVLCVAYMAFSRTVAGQQHTFEEVASGLKHQDPATRLRAIEILKDADYADAAVPIAATLADRDDRVQLAAIDAERSLFTTRPTSRRRKVGYIVEVRSTATVDGVLALKPRRVPVEVLAGLAAALRDNSPQVRAEAIPLAFLLAPVGCGAGLQSFGSDIPCADIGNALVENINSRQAQLRRGAMRALGQLRYARAVQALSDQLSYHQRGADALAALEGLAGIGDSTSVSIFRELLTSPEADIRQLAVEGIARAGAGDALGELQQMGQSERSAGVLLALHYAHVKLGAAGRSLQELVAALNVPPQRQLALKYLVDVAPLVAPLLAESLRDKNPDVRRLVADVLGFSRDTAVVAALDAAAKDADADVAEAARHAMERIRIFDSRNPGTGG